MEKCFGPGNIFFTHGAMCRFNCILYKPYNRIYPTLDIYLSGKVGAGISPAYPIKLYDCFLTKSFDL